MIRGLLDPATFVVFLGGFVGIFASIALVKKRNRVGFTLAISVVWLSLNRYEQLPTLALMAKQTSPLVYGLLIIAAFQFTKLNQLTSVSWLYVVNLFVYFAAILGASDFDRAFPKAITWSLLVVSCLFAASTANTKEKRLNLLWWLAMGCTLATLIAASSIITGPGAAFRAGLGRFFPYGANPNQIGALFFVTTLFASANLIICKSSVERAFWSIGTVVAFALAILTGSRGIVFLSILATIPYLRHSINKLSTLIYILVGMSGAAFYIQRTVERVDIARLSNLESGRFETWKVFFKRLTAQEWLIGKIGQQGFNSEIVDFGFASSHIHNGYLKWFYLGGLLALCPLLIIVLRTVIVGFKNLTSSTRILDSPNFWIYYFCLLAFSYAFVNQSLYEPTNPLGILHVLCTLLVINPLLKDSPSNIISVGSFPGRIK